MTPSINSPERRLYVDACHWGCYDCDNQAEVSSHMSSCGVYALCCFYLLLLVWVLIF